GRGAARGGGDGGWWPRANACRGGWPGRAGTALAGNQSRLLPEPVVAGTSQRSPAGAAEPIPGSGSGGTLGGRSDKAQSAGAGTRATAAGPEAALEETAAARLHEAGAPGGGQHGRERPLVGR